MTLLLATISRKGVGWFLFRHSGLRKVRLLMWRRVRWSLSRKYCSGRILRIVELSRWVLRWSRSVGIETWS